MTIDSVEIIKTILKNNGTYPGDPQCYSVHSYTNDWGNKTFHISMNLNGELSMHLSPYVHNEVLLWNRNGLTPEGKKLINNFNSNQNLFNSFANELREMGVDEKTIEKEWEDYLELNGQENEPNK